MTSAFIGMCFRDETPRQLRRRRIFHLTAPNTDKRVWERFSRLERATTEFMECMPRLDDMRGFDGGDGSFQPNVNPALVLLETAVLMAALCLTDVQAANDPSQREQRLDLAVAGADMARQLRDVALIYHHVTIGVSTIFIISTINALLIPPHGNLDGLVCYGRSANRGAR